MAFVDADDMVKPPARTFGVLPLLTKNLTGWKQAIFADRDTESVSSTMTPKKKKKKSKPSGKVNMSALSQRDSEIVKPLTQKTSKKTLTDSQKFGRHAGVLVQ